MGRQRLRPTSQPKTERLDRTSNRREKFAPALSFLIVMLPGIIAAAQASSHVWCCDCLSESVNVSTGLRERNVLRSGLTERAGLQRREPAQER
jgi:hypothetical protein